MKIFNHTIEDNKLIFQELDKGQLITFTITPDKFSCKVEELTERIWFENRVGYFKYTKALNKAIDNYGRI